MSILVSIDCITYNHEKYIAEAIEGFLMQKTNFQYEILIHDDASTDNTVKIIKEYENMYPDLIKGVYQKENQYSKGKRRISYNFNFPRARGKYIAICEGDDYWTDPYKLQKQVDYMEKNLRCSMCFHAAEVVKTNKEKIKEIKPYNSDCISSTEDIIVGGAKFIATNSILYRKKLLNNAPSFYLNASIGDYPLQVMASVHDYAYYINEFMSAYRIGVEESWTNNILSKKNIKKTIMQRDGNIGLFNDLNKYTNYKYNKQFTKIKLKSKLKIKLLQYIPNIYLNIVKFKSGIN